MFIGNFTVNSDIKRNICHVGLVGVFDKVCLTDLVEDFNEKKKSFNLREGYLIVDCSLLSLFKPDYIPKAIEFFKSCNEFSQVNIIKNPRPLVNICITKLLRDNGFEEKFGWLDSMPVL